MKHLLSAMVFALLAGALARPLRADDYVPYRPAFERLAMREGGPDQAERRERMRTLREEMQRTQPRPSQADDERRDAAREFAHEGARAPHHMPPERRDSVPLSSRDANVIRRLSPEERREFRRQLHDAGRNVYHSQ
jgi:hypothetical protein